MADEDNVEGAEAPAEEAVKSGGGSKRIIIIAGFFVVLLVVQVGVAYFIGEKFIRQENKAAKAKADLDRKKDEDRKKQTSMGLTLPEPIEVTVNIANTDGQSRFAVLGVQFEWDPEYVQMEELLLARMPRIKDIIIKEVSKRPLSELQSIEGKKNITGAIMNDVNSKIPDPSEDKSTGGQVRNVFLDKFIIQ